MAPPAARPPAAEGADGAGLVGRSDELTRTRAAFTGGDPVVLVGEAGAGKTALLRAAAAGCQRTCFHGGGLATLAWRPYTGFHRAFGVPPPDGDPARVADWVADRVGHGVLVLDDLQWCSPATLALLGTLGRRITVVAAVRSDEPGSKAALAAATGAGLLPLTLPPLGPDEAASVVRRLRAGLDPAAVEDIVRRAGGNPLLLEELTAYGATSATLQRVVAARLAALPERARSGMALLALVGRPIPAPVLGTATAVLTDAGLVRATPDGSIEVRHALLGEAALAGVSATDRSRLHRRIAEALDDPGEAARHYAAAGESTLAYSKALEAAGATDVPGERAAHLKLAAENASGPGAFSLRIRAADALCDATDYIGAEDLLDELPSTGPIGARAMLTRSRARWLSGDADGARAALVDGLRLVEGSGSDVEIRLRIDAARLTLLCDMDGAAAAAEATAALALAEERGLATARARYVLGSADYISGGSAWRDHLARARAEARAENDHEVEFLAGHNLIIAHKNAGDPQLARSLASEMREWARGLGFAYWDRQFTALELSCALGDGDYAHVISGCTALRAQSLATVPRTREETTMVLAVALVDVGRLDEALALIDEETDRVGPDPRGRGTLSWPLAEARLWGGDAAGALQVATEWREGGRPDPLLQGHLAAVAAHAAVQLGRPVPEAQPQLLPATRGLADELTGLRAAASGDPALATKLFDGAAEAYAPYQLRAALRCRWLAGQARLDAGDRDGAERDLLELERQLEARGMQTLLAAVRRSLRACGVRRAARRGDGGSGLTQREEEVLRLVGQGLTDVAIARRLGVTPRTVASQVASARTKLGARTRRQAASMLRP
jgi:DNA-binding CsgD family transcriptional regulator